MVFQAYLFYTSIFGDVRVSGGRYFSNPTQLSFQYVLMCVSPAAGVCFSSRPASPFIASGIVAGVYPSFPPESGTSLCRHILPRRSAFGNFFVCVVRAVCAAQTVMLCV